jgi:hypothetical protein
MKIAVTNRRVLLTVLTVFGAVVATHIGYDTMCILPDDARAAKSGLQRARHATTSPHTTRHHVLAAVRICNMHICRLPALSLDLTGATTIRH